MNTYWEHQTHIWTSNKLIEHIYDFSMNMVHNEFFKPDIQGNRKELDIFINAFQGKIAEAACICIFQKYNYDISMKDLDLNIYPRGQWDIGDIILKDENKNDVYFDVKSIKENSNFLLLETSRFNEDGSLSYKNSDGSSHKLDAYCLVKVGFNKDLYKDNPLNLSKEEFLSNLSVRTTYIGSITLDDFWKYKRLVPRGIFCNGRNFTNVWNGVEPIKANNEEEIVKNRTRYIQTDNYLINSRVLQSTVNTLSKRLHIKQKSA